VGVLIAGGIGAFLWLTKGDAPSTPASRPEEGVACADLRAASDHYQAGNDAQFEEAVNRAARVGELALDRSGQVFGRPEKIALELLFAVTENPRESPFQVRRLLAEVSEACKRAGS
jgi:hypothetical protein